MAETGLIEGGLSPKDREMMEMGHPPKLGIENQPQRKEAFGGLVRGFLTERQEEYKGKEIIGRSRILGDVLDLARNDQDDIFERRTEIPDADKKLKGLTDLKKVLVEVTASPLEDVKDDSLREIGDYLIEKVEEDEAGDGRYQDTLMKYLGLIPDRLLPEKYQYENRKKSGETKDEPELIVEEEKTVEALTLEEKFPPRALELAPFELHAGEKTDEILDSIATQEAPLTDTQVEQLLESFEDDFTKEDEKNKDTSTWGSYVTIVNAALEVRQQLDEMEKQGEIDDEAAGKNIYVVYTSDGEIKYSGQEPEGQIEEGDEYVTFIPLGVDKPSALDKHALHKDEAEIEKKRIENLKKAVTKEKMTDKEREQFGFFFRSHIENAAVEEKLGAFMDSKAKESLIHKLGEKVKRVKPRFKRHGKTL